MTRIGIIICGRYQACGGGKCFRALRERRGTFARYAADEQVEVVGYSTCGGCPGGNIEYVPEEMKKNGAEVIHLATCFLVGYPPCRDTARFKAFIETAHGIPVEIGSHPIPLKYVDRHQRLPFWKEQDTFTLAAPLMAEPDEIKRAYD